MSNGLSVNKKFYQTPSPTDYHDARIRMPEERDGVHMFMMLDNTEVEMLLCWAWSEEDESWIFADVRQFHQEPNLFRYWSRILVPDPVQ